jgi:hypothetical protein
VITGSIIAGTRVGPTKKSVDCTCKNMRLINNKDGVNAYCPPVLPCNVVLEQSCPPFQTPLGQFCPKCKAENPALYVRKQFNQGYEWCVHPVTGIEIPSTKQSSGDPKKIACTCRSMRELKNQAGIQAFC